MNEWEKARKKNKSHFRLPLLILIANHTGCETFIFIFFFPLFHFPFLFISQLCCRSGSSLLILMFHMQGPHSFLFSFHYVLQKPSLCKFRLLFLIGKMLDGIKNIFANLNMKCDCGMKRMKKKSIYA